MNKQFHVSAPPGEIFKMLDPQSDDEALALDDLLGVPEMVKDLYRELRRSRRKVKNGVLMCEHLHPVAQTPHYDIVAVFLRLVASAKQNQTLVEVYLVEPDRFEELRLALKAKFVKVGKEMLNFQRGLEGRN